MGDDLAGVLLSEAQIAARLDELAAQIDGDYAGATCCSSASSRARSW